MDYRRMPIEIEAPEQLGYDQIRCNLTESSFADFKFGDLGLDLNSLVIAYGDHLGKRALRELLAKDAGLAPDEVMLTVGAAAALFIVSTSLLRKGDRLLVMRPNYATNIETPRAIGASIDFLDLKFEDGYRLSLDQLEKAITPTTKLVSLTCPHNPTGMMMSEAELRAVIALCERKGVRLLLDETYREMSFVGVLPVGAAISKNVISVSSLSKTYGLPGIRMGWLMTQDTKLMETFLAAKEQIFITNSMVDEEIAYQFFVKRAQFLPQILGSIRRRFEITKSWMQSQDVMEWVEPKGGCVSFPRFKASSGVDPEKFYKILNDKYSTHVGPGHWFEMERRSMRIGYGWPTDEILREGLAHVTKAALEARA